MLENYYEKIIIIPFLKEFTFPGKPPTAFPTELVFLLLSVVYCSPLGELLPCNS